MKDIGDQVFCGALFLSSVLLYVPTLHGGYVWDDRAAIIGNADVTGVNNLSQLFQHDFWGQDIRLFDSHKSYRPITTLSFRLNHFLHGLDASGFHVLNVLIYACVVLLVYAVASQWLTNKPSARVASVLFCFHPIHVEAVASLVGRADSLCGMFYLLSMVCHDYAMRYGAILDINTRTFPKWQSPPLSEAAATSTASKVQTAHSKHSWLFFSASMLLALLATLSKEIGMTAFGVLAVMEIAHVIRTNHSDCDAGFVQYLQGVQTVLADKSSLARLGFIFSTLGSLTAARIWLNGPYKLYTWSELENHVTLLPFVQSRVLSYAQTHFWYAEKLLFPRYLCFDYGFACLPVVHDAFDWRNLLPLITYGIIVKSAVTAVQTARIGLLVGLLLLLLPLFPALNILFPIGTTLAERLLFVPSIGFCFLAAEMLVVDLGRFWIGLDTSSASCDKLSSDQGSQSISNHDAAGCGNAIANFGSVDFQLSHPPRVRFDLRQDGKCKTTPYKTKTYLSHPSVSSPRRFSRTKTKLPQPLLLFLSSVCLLGAIRIFARNDDWNSEPRIYQSALRVCPLSAKALTNFAVLCATAKTVSAGRDQLIWGWDGQSFSNCLAAARTALHVYAGQYTAHINAGKMHNCYSLEV